MVIENFVKSAFLKILVSIFFSPIENEFRPLSAKKLRSEFSFFYDSSLSNIRNRCFYAECFNGVSANVSGLGDGGQIEAETFN